MDNLPQSPCTRRGNYFQHTSSPPPKQIKLQHDLRFELRRFLRVLATDSSELCHGELGNVENLELQGFTGSAEVHSLVGSA